MADVIIGAEAFYDATDLSGLGVEFNVDIGGEVLEHRPFNASMVRKQGGMRNDGGSLSGVMSSTEPGQTMYTDVLTDKPVSFLFNIGTYAAQAAEGDLAFFADAVNAGVQLGAANGQLYTWNLPFQAKPLVLGNVLARGTKTSTGNGSGVEFTGGVADGQSVYALLHVPTATSGTIDMIIESDADNGFASAETRFTFTQVTTSATSQFMSWTPAGGDTDDWYRASWTSASTPSHDVVVVMGIL
jgi:hypothetical protein